MQIRPSCSHENQINPDSEAQAKESVLDAQVFPFSDQHGQKNTMDLVMIGVFLVAFLKGNL